MYSWELSVCLFVCLFFARISQFVLHLGGVSCWREEIIEFLPNLGTGSFISLDASILHMRFVFCVS